MFSNSYEGGILIMSKDIRIKSVTAFKTIPKYVLAVQASDSNENQIKSLCPVFILEKNLQKSVIGYFIDGYNKRYLYIGDFIVKIDDHYEIMSPTEFYCRYERTEE